MDEFNYDQLMGRSMRIMWCQRDASSRKCSKSNVVVKGLPKHIDSKQLHDLFKGFGEILSSKVGRLIIKLNKINMFYFVYSICFYVNTLNSLLQTLLDFVFND